MNEPTVLLIPEKTDTEFEQVLASWTNRGGAIKRLGKYWIRDEQLAQRKIAIYGNQTFAPVLAQVGLRWNLTPAGAPGSTIAMLKK